MKNINNIKNVLEFYLMVDSLNNTIIDEKNNYSTSDHLYGGMILATAINSEFKEADNLAKIYRMMLFNELNKLYPNYQFTNLNNGNEFYGELKEAKQMITKDSILANNYCLLDTLLTKLIDRFNDNPDKLLEEGSLLISLFCNKEKEECKGIFKYYYINCRLKNKVRAGWNKTHWDIIVDRKERVSEHVVGTVGLAIVNHSEFKHNYNIDEVLITLVNHEIGETIIGDITPFDGITVEEKERIEYEAIEKILSNLKDKDKILSLLNNFKDKNTTEAKVAYYTDKLHADIKAKLYQDQGLHHPLDEQENNVVFKSKKVLEMIKNGAKTPNDIWFEWDKQIYINDYEYHEYFDILRVIKDNNILELGNNVIKENVKLNDKDYNQLLSLIGSEINSLKDDYNVDCIYITNVQSKENDGIIKVTVILNELVNYRNFYDHDFMTGLLNIIDYKELFDSINNNIKKNNTTNVKVEFSYNVKMPDTFGLILNDNLMESTIIYDKSGYITKQKESLSKYIHQRPIFVVNFEPPIDSALSLKNRLK